MESTKPRHLVISVKNRKLLCYCVRVCVLSVESFSRWSVGRALNLREKNGDTHLKAEIGPWKICTLKKR